MPDLLGSLILQVVGVVIIAAAAFGGRLSPLLRSGAARAALLVVGVASVGAGQWVYRTHRIVGDGENVSMRVTQGSLAPHGERAG